MKPAHVNIKIIVYANRREYFCRQQQRQLAHKAFLCISGVHRITNPRHIVYVNRFLTLSCFPPMSPPSMTTQRDVKTWGVFVTELWSRVFSSKEKSVWRKSPRKKLINYWQQNADRSESKKPFTENCSGWRWNSFCFFAVSNLAEHNSDVTVS